jgi:hypothetical protein
MEVEVEALALVPTMAPASFQLLLPFILEPIEEQPCERGEELVCEAKKG